MRDQRKQRMRDTLSCRQHDVTVYTQGIYNPHNLSAVIRSCDAVGVHHVAYSQVGYNKTGYSINVGVTMGANKWLDITSLQDEQNFLADQTSQGKQIVTTALVDQSVDFRQVDYTLPTVIVLGNEVSGVTDEIIAASDHVVTIPMLGMVQSLNISVAAAVMLYELQRQREQAGMYRHELGDKGNELLDAWIARDEASKKNA